MKQLLLGAAKVLPKVLEQSLLQVSLSGWPAAVAAVAVSATVIVVTTLLKEKPAATTEE